MCPLRTSGTTPAQRLRTRYRGDGFVLRGVEHDEIAAAGRRGGGPAGRVALVSGGNRGLGLRIVGSLAERGMRVVLGSRSVRNGQVAIELLGDLAGRVAVRQLDVTDAASVARLASWLDRRLGGCDVLVNNCAVLFDDDGDTAARVDPDVVSRTLQTVLGLYPELDGKVDFTHVTRWTQALPHTSLGAYRKIGDFNARLDRSAPIQFAADYMSAAGQNTAVVLGNRAAENLRRQMPTRTVNLRLH